MNSPSSSTTPSRPYAVFIMLVFCTLFWGSNFNLGKYIVDGGTDPMTASSWRFALAAFFMAAFLLVQQRPDWQGFRRNGWDSSSSTGLR